jgi:hypothetical protein
MTYVFFMKEEKVMKKIRKIKKVPFSFTKNRFFVKEKGKSSKGQSLLLFKR